MARSRLREVRGTALPSTLITKPFSSLSDERLQVPRAEQVTEVERDQGHDDYHWAMVESTSYVDDDTHAKGGYSTERDIECGEDEVCPEDSGEASLKSDEVLTTLSSQLLSGPSDTPAPIEWRHMPEGAGVTPDANVHPASRYDSSYFIMDEGGRHVLDDQGSPARARMWRPLNTNQLERYQRLQLATKGPGATCRWLPSVLVSPDHLRVPRARAVERANGVRGAGGCVGPSQRLPFGDARSASDDLKVVGAGRRRQIEEAKKRRRLLAEERRRTRPKELDGFMLMSACECELPDEGQRADVSGSGLVAAVQEDMSYFVRLRIVDAGDNSLPFDSFVCLPRLEELRLPCNGIRNVTIPWKAYSELVRLDLSYNNLTRDAVSVLARLPSLTDLDLTCNGLESVPESAREFSQLQKLSLERNELESDADIDALSRLPALRELKLAFNYFAAIKLSPASVEYGFPVLEDLDLAFNYISHEDDVATLVLLERLQRIILYGNPLTGPTGEDVLGLCVERLIKKADSIREDWSSHPLEVITEMPRKKQTRGKGRRQRPYADIGVTMVDEGCLPPAGSFRKAGNETLSRNQVLLRAEPLPEAVVEAALQSAKACCRRRRSSAAQDRDDNVTFMTGVERQHDGVSDDCSDDAPLPDSAAQAHDELGGCISTAMLRRPVEPNARGDPVKLKMALTALRHTLKHPVSSSMDVPCHRGQKLARYDMSTGIMRKTAAARARQLPRRPYSLLRGKRKSFCASLLEAPTAGSDLAVVDRVLTSMNADMDDVAPEKRAEKDGADLARPALSSIIRTVNAVLDANEE